MMKRLLPFINKNENSFVQFLEEINHLQPKCKDQINDSNCLNSNNSTRKYFTVKQDNTFLTKKREYSDFILSNTVKSFSSDNKLKEAETKANNSHESHHITSFANFEEKAIIDTQIKFPKIDKAEKSMIFAENPLDLYKYYFNEGETKDQASRIEEAKEALNKIIEEIKLIPVIPLKFYNENRLKKFDLNQESNPNPIKKRNEAAYVCEFCGQLFDSASSKGGHMRSHHPGQSEKYKKKIEKANKRVKERELNKEAQRLFLLKLKNPATGEKIYTKQVEIKKIKEDLKNAGFMKGQ